MNPNIIVWMDLGTTGLDVEKDTILEVGIVLTDWQLGEISRKNWIVGHPDNVIDNIIPEVKRIHTDNGLLDEVRKNFSKSKQSLSPMAHTEYLVMSYLQPYIRKACKFVIGGNSVHFDKAMIDAKMMLLGTLFNHRVIDIGGVGILSERWTPNKHREVRSALGKSEKSTYRSMNDIDKCITRARVYKKLLFVDNS